MISCADFSDLLVNNGVDFFAGVPDSLLKDFCAYTSDNHSENHILTANEGNAIGIAAGYHLATGKVPMVYLQNSGLGNAVNPLVSLSSKDVYQLPVILLIGWRGEPGIIDEPQHVMQGRITPQLLNAMEIPYEHLNKDTEDTGQLVADLIKQSVATNGPVALLVSAGTFEPYVLKDKKPDQGSLSREEAVNLFTDKIDGPNTVILSTTGKLSRELYEHRKRTDGPADFYNVGSMGHVSQIALGVAKYSPSTRVFCFDGDGAALMHLGGLAIAASEKLENFYYVMFNNSAHESVGGQPTVADQIDFKLLALGLGYRQYFFASTPGDLESIAAQVKAARGPLFIEIQVKNGSRSDLGRPRETPLQNKLEFIKCLRK